MSYRLTAHQLKDISRYVAALNEADISLENHPEPYGVPKMNWGDGYRAILRLTRIPIYTDADEFLGYIERDDYSYVFRSTDEEPAK